MEPSNVLSIQKEKSSTSITLSSALDSSRANDNFGPRQPPGARNTRMVDFGLSLKKDSNSLRAPSVSLIIIPPLKA